MSDEKKLKPLGLPDKRELAGTVPIDKVRVNPLANADRITWVMHLTHQTLGDDPVQASCRGDRMLDTQYEPYVRRLIISENLEKIDTSWIPSTNVGLIVILNVSGMHRLVLPTDEERAADQKKVIEVMYYGVRGERVRPGLFTVIDPIDFETIQIKANAPDTRAKIFIFPA